ncbi:MAG: type II toxin-antitoxin system RelE/ParE family toxin [Candidatus Poribacteria bacterium]|nr:type II toxin-antitoxin system RelE/ParE family toxin [Candidatus Poribacteria bacterium]
MSRTPVLSVSFFRTDAGRLPVQQWLRELDKTARKVIGEDIRLVQFRWPLGMPLVRKMETDLWEIRSRLSGRRIARILFSVRGSKIILLHGFIKKSRNTPQRDLNLARNRRKLWQSGGLLYE